MLSLDHRKPGHQASRSRRTAEILFLLLLWAVIYLASLFRPPLLDDADATHAQAAQTMLRTGDWVTLHVNGIRYLEKAPLPYWITAISLRAFGMNSFAAHLPLALTVLGLAALAWLWGNRAFGTLPSHDPTRAGFYAALFTLTSVGVFLFTRVFIPDALLSLLLAFTLYAALRALELEPPASRGWALAAWIALGLAVLTKGLVALVFLFGVFLVYLPFSGEIRKARRLHPVTGLCVFLIVAAPWHILAGLRNRGGANGHGFFWFYFINEHVLRFLGRRIPADYNKLPPLLYWSLHLVWLFPWSFFSPLVALMAWEKRSSWWPWQPLRNASFQRRSVLLLALYAALILVFFSLSTNQEYYTLPAYLPLLLLAAGAFARFDDGPRTSRERRLALWCHGALTAVGLLASAALAFGLWTSRRLPAAPNIGDLFAHRGVGDYTLSMSHFFDLTSASFSALRLPALLAFLALAIGPAAGLLLRLGQRHLAATVTVALTSALFLVAAHLALVRFTPLLSSHDFAVKILTLEQSGAVSPDAEVVLYGDQALGSSIPFYLGHPVLLVAGRSTSMLFGSTFADAPPIFLTPGQLRAGWGNGTRKLLFVPLEHRDDVLHLLGSGPILLYESSGKALFTDRPLAQTAADRAIGPGSLVTPP